MNLPDKIMAFTASWAADLLERDPDMESTSLDALFSPELKYWARQQEAPAHARGRLLLAAAQQEQVQSHAGDEAYSSEGLLQSQDEWTKDTVEGYLTLVFQNSHVRLVA